MSRPGISLFIMVDALGSRFLQDHSFLPELDQRASLRTVLGYSCACEPTILTGRLPSEHGHGAMYMRREGPSPLDVAKKFSWLPRIVRDNHRIRSRIHGEVSRTVDGYFSLYECPTHLLPQFDLVEHRDIFRPGAFRNGTGIFDDLESLGVRWSSYNWRTAEEANFQSVERDIESDRADWILLYLPTLDGLLHAEGLGGMGVLSHLAWYEAKIRALLEKAHDHTPSVECYVFSDHGMSAVHEALALIEPIEHRFGPNGSQYLGFYDSTMARFWVEDVQLRAEFEVFLAEQSGGRLIPEAELTALGSNIPGGRQGDLFFVVDEGRLLLPSYMGQEILAGMHGYHPDAEWADACLLGTDPRIAGANHLRDVYGLMRSAAQRLSPKGEAP